MFRIKHELNNTVKLEPLDCGSSENTKVARFYLIDRTRFEVQVEFDADLQELFKTMNTKRYDPANKRWSFDLKDYNDLVKKITDKFSRSKINVDPLPKLVRELFKDQIAGKQTHRIDPEIDLDLLKTKIDLNITKNLLSFQVEGICFGVQQQGRLLLADDMGLGKTLQVGFIQFFVLN
jgi:SNF2 family DNA or RNA helicase